MDIYTVIAISSSRGSRLGDSLHLKSLGALRAPTFFYFLVKTIFLRRASRAGFKGGFFTPIYRTIQNRILIFRRAEQVINLKKMIF